MRYRDTIAKLSFGLVFVYLAFDIKLGGHFKYFDSSWFKLLASFIFMYFGLRVNQSGDDPSCGSSSLVSVLLGVFGRQFNSESGYDYYYFSPSKFSSSIEYSSIISGILGLKLILNTYVSDFSWYLNSISCSAFSEIACLVLLCSSLNIYIQTFGKIRLHDFMYQIYYLQNTGGAWASVYLCQLQSMGYVLSLAVYVSEFVDSISQEVLDLSLYFTNILYSRFYNPQIYISYLQACSYIYNFKIGLINNLSILTNYISTNFNNIVSNFRSNTVSNFNSLTEENLNLNCDLELLQCASSTCYFTHLKTGQLKVYNLICIEVLFVRSISIVGRFSSNIKVSRVPTMFKDDNIAYGKSPINYNTLNPILRC